VVGATWEWPWLREFVFGNATGYFDASLGRWNSHVDNASRSAAWITQIGLTPVLRWHLFGSSPRVFAEAGIGLNVLVPIFRTTDKQFSTAFNFGDHIAVGMQFGEGGLHEVSLRLQHFSSACIKEPNPGENFVQLRYGMRY
jgi:lipid A 3-O-deacylase